MWWLAANSESTRFSLILRFHTGTVPSYAELNLRLGSADVKLAMQADLDTDHKLRMIPATTVTQCREGVYYVVLIPGGVMSRLIRIGHRLAYL